MKKYVHNRARPEGNISKGYGTEEVIEFCVDFIPDLKPIGCEILAQGLTGLIEYSYQQVATSFPEAHLEGTPRLSVLGPEHSQGWVTDREVLPGCARVRTKCAEKTGVDL